MPSERIEKIIRRESVSKSWSDDKMIILAKNNKQPGETDAQAFVRLLTKERDPEMVAAYENSVASIRKLAYHRMTGDAEDCTMPNDLGRTAANLDRIGEQLRVALHEYCVVDPGNADLAWRWLK